MALVPFKNLLRFLQKKCSKHLKIDQKDLSRVAKFVSHDGIFIGGTIKLIHDLFSILLLVRSIPFPVYPAAENLF